MLENGNGGWIGKWKGPESMDNVQPMPPEILERLYKVYAETFGGRVKIKDEKKDGHNKVC